jgi:hypothetical protein
MENNMAESIMKATGAPIEIEINSKIYKISPLSPGDLAAFESWIKSNKLRILDGLGYSVKDKTDMILRILSDPISAEEYHAANSSIGGIRYLIWLSIKKLASMTLEEMDSVVTMDNMGQVLNIINSIGMDSEQPPFVDPKEKVDTSPSPKDAVG